MKTINRFLPAGLLSLAIATTGMVMPVSVANAQALSLDDLLEQVQQGRVRDNTENDAREQRFEQNRAQRAQMLADMKAERARQEARSTQLETQFDQFLRLLQPKREYFQMFRATVLQRAPGKPRDGRDN